DLALQHIPVKVYGLLDELNQLVVQLLLHVGLLLLILSMSGVTGGVGLGCLEVRLLNSFGRSQDVAARRAHLCGGVCIAGLLAKGTELGLGILRDALSFALCFSNPA